MCVVELWSQGCASVEKMQTASIRIRTGDRWTVEDVELEQIDWWREFEWSEQSVYGGKVDPLLEDHHAGYNGNYWRESTFTLHHP
jgi:hypothetical protein